MFVCTVASEDNPGSSVEGSHICDHLSVCDSNFLLVLWSYDLSLFPSISKPEPRWCSSKSPIDQTHPTANTEFGDELKWELCSWKVHWNTGQSIYVHKETYKCCFRSLRVPVCFLVWLQVQLLRVSSGAEFPLLVLTIAAASWFIASFPVLVLIPFRGVRWCRHGHTGNSLWTSEWKGEGKSSPENLIYIYIRTIFPVGISNCHVI